MSTSVGDKSITTKDLPDKAVAVGIPAKIISYKGSQDFILYIKFCLKLKIANLKKNCCLLHLNKANSTAVNWRILKF